MADTVFCIGNGESRIGFDLEQLRPHGKIYGCNALYRDFTPDVLVAVDHGIIHEVYHSGYAKKNTCYFREWTKQPAETYHLTLYGTLDKDQIEEVKKHVDVIHENERGNSKEFVFHGANLSGIVNIIKRWKGKPNTEDVMKKEIKHNSVYVSWVEETDPVHTLKEVIKPKDRGWACGATSGLIACIKEKPKDVYLIGHDLNSKHQKLNNIYKSTRHYANENNAAIPSVNWVDQWKKIFREYKDINFWKVNEIVEDRSNEIYVGDDVNKKVLHWDGTVPNIKYIDYNELKRRLTLA
jgi:hypothetical protein